MPAPDSIIIMFPSGQAGRRAARYHSKSVIRTDGAVPTNQSSKQILSAQNAADEELKRLVAKQLDSSASLANYTSTDDSRYVSVAEAADLNPQNVAGLRKLEDFQKEEKRHERMAQLREYGLTESQVQLKMRVEGYYSFSSSASPEVMTAQLAEIDANIRQREQDLERKFSEESMSNVPLQSLSRHARDVELSMIRCKSKQPLSHLFELDAAKKPKLETEKVHANSAKPLVVSTPVQLLSDETVAATRASAEDIAQVDPNYFAGSPSPILFVKNLPKDITEVELLSLFARFQQAGKEKLVFKLLDGRMKGRAFVTFPDERTAMEALKFSHGYCMRPKQPILVAFGKKQVLNPP